MITIHHLATSQSERVLWLCEELGIAYDLVRHERMPGTRTAPPALRALTPMGSAPVLQDGELVMGESGAIVEYLIHRHGGGRFALPPGHPDYPHYLFWFHFANATLQALMARSLALERLEVPPDNAYGMATRDRLQRALLALDGRLQNSPWLAGTEFTAADIMTVFSLTTEKLFVSFDLAPYPGILAYLQRVGGRPAYRRAMAKGDPGLEPILR